MPIVEDILEKYSSGWDLVWDRFVSFCFSFGSQAVGSKFPVLGSVVGTIGAFIDGETDAKECISVILSYMSAGPSQIEQWTVTTLNSALVALENWTGIDEHSRDKMMDPFYMTVEEMRASGIYARQQDLGK